MTELGREHLLLFLGSDDVGDVDKGQKHAVDFLSAGTIGEDACKVVAFPADKAHCAFDHLAATRHLPHVILQVGVVEPADDIGQRSTAVAGNEIEQFGNRRRKAANDEILVEKNRRDLGTLKQIVEIAISVTFFVNLTR